MSDDALWVRTASTPDGLGYVGVLELGEDHSVELTEELAQRIANHIHEACVRAEFDGKVFRQMFNVLDPDAKREAAAHAIMELRERRGFMDDTTGLPFVMVPNVNSEGKPFLVVQVDNRPTGQVELPDAYSLATHIVTANSWARRDQEYLKYLIEVIELEEPIARNAVQALHNI